MIQNQALEFALMQIYEIAEAIFKETSAELNASLVLCFRWVEGAKLPVAKSGFAGLRSKKYIKGKLLRANGGCLG